MVDKETGYNNIDFMKFWCNKVIPLVYDDSLSYYETLCKVVSKLNEVIESTNNIPNYIKNLLNETGVLDNLQEQIASTNEHDSKTATADRTKGSLIWLNGDLYLITRNMLAGDQYVESSEGATGNIEKITIEDWTNRLFNLLQGLINNVDAKTQENKRNIQNEIDARKALISDDDGTTNIKGDGAIVMNGTTNVLKGSNIIIPNASALTASADSLTVAAKNSPILNFQAGYSLVGTKYNEQMSSEGVKSVTVHGLAEQISGKHTVYAEAEETRLNSNERKFFFKNGYVDLYDLRNTASIVVYAKDFGCKADGKTDDAKSLQDAINYAKTLVKTESVNNIPTYWNVPKIVLPSGLILISKPINIDFALELCGSGSNTRIRPTANISSILNFVKNTDTTIDEEHQIEGLCVHDLTFDGNYRKFTINGAISLANYDHATFYNIWFYCVKGSAFKCLTVRESTWHDIYTRFCGDTDKAVFDFNHVENADSSNHNRLINTFIVFPFGSGIKEKDGLISITNIMFHGLFAGINIGTYFPNETYRGNHVIDIDNTVFSMSQFTWAYTPNGKYFINGNNSKITLTDGYGGGHYTESGSEVDLNLTDKTEGFANRVVTNAKYMIKTDATSFIGGEIRSLNELDGSRNEYGKIKVPNQTVEMLYSASLNVLKAGYNRAEQPASGLIRFSDNEDKPIFQINLEQINAYQPTHFNKCGNQTTLILPTMFSYESTQQKEDGSLWVDQSNRLCVKIGGKNYSATLTEIS